MMTGRATKPHPRYQPHAPTPYRALTSPLSVRQWPGLLFPLPSGIFAFPAVPSAEDTPGPIQAPSSKTPNPKARTL